jgi:hypothetical protein
MQEPTQTPGAAGAPNPGATEAGPPTWSADPAAAEAPESTTAGPAAGDAPRRTPTGRTLGLAALLGAVVVGSLAVGFAAGTRDTSPAETPDQPGLTGQVQDRGQGRGSERDAVRLSEAAWTSPDGRTSVALDGRGGRGMRGIAAREITITAIDGTKLSLETDNGWTRTIDAAGATVTKDGETVALSTLKVGDQIAFRETRNADGTSTITAIYVVQPSVSGTVASVSGSTVTVTTRDGATEKVVLTSTTTFRLGGAEATKDAVVAGVRIRAEGSLASDGTLTATSVVVAPATTSGTVKEKTASSITLTKRDGSTVVVKVTSTTTYSVQGVDSATLADIAVGNVVMAAGTTNADGSLTATTVRARAAGSFGGPDGDGGWGRGWGRGGHGGMPGWDDAPASSPAPTGDGANG